MRTFEENKSRSFKEGEGEMYNVNLLYLVDYKKMDLKEISH